MFRIYSFSSNTKSSNFASFPKNLSLNQIDQLIRGLYHDVKLPVAFQHAMGKKKLTDILDTGHPSFFLISDRFKKILENNQTTEWKTYPIILLDKDGQEIPGYHGFSVIGTCGPKDYLSSPIIEKKYVERGPVVKFYKGLKVTPDTEVDFFKPPKSLSIYISKNSALILKKNKLKNLKLTPISEIELDCELIDIYLK